MVKDCNVQGPEICRTEYESECWTKQEVHDVEDDVVECSTVVEEKCEDETSGYTTNTKCSSVPREVCSVSKKNVKKYTPITGCTKEPRQLCAPAGCGFKKVKNIINDPLKISELGGSYLLLIHNFWGDTIVLNKIFSGTRRVS